MMWSQLGFVEKFTPNSYRIHTEFSSNVHRIEHEYFNNNNSITLLKYNIHRQFGEKVRRVRLKYVESECRDV